MDVAGAGVAHAADIMRRPQPLGRFRRVHVVDVRIVEARLHRFGMLEIFRQEALALADIEMAGPEVDLDVVRLGEFKQMRLGLLGDVEQRLGALESVFGLQFLSAGTLPGAELPAIAPGGAVAKAVRLDQDHRRA